MTRSKKIFVGNYKGGVGKTTSIYQIALHMVESGKRVLLIDLDPQCSLSEICLSRLKMNLQDLQPNESLNYVYDMWYEVKQFPNLHVQIDKKTLIKQTDDGVHFIPSNMFYPNGGLDDLATKLRDDFYDLLPLQQFFQSSQIEGDFDYILFDCPPSNNMITQGAFLLSDYYLIPTIIQTMSVRGVVHYVRTVESIYATKCEQGNHSTVAKLLFGAKPELLGVFETLKKRGVNNDTVMNELHADLEKSKVKSKLSTATEEKFLFDTIIYNYENIARLTADGLKCSEYVELTNEILVCMGDKPIRKYAVLGD
ncbi:AAA family ATPase [Bacillus timonensis]|nr:AAA family ATPase [Bacillus timonensis]